MKSTTLLALPVLSILFSSNAFAQPDAPADAPQTPPPPSAPPLTTPQQAPDPTPAPTTSPGITQEQLDAAVAAAVADPAKNPALAKDGHPLAGYHDGLFYMRDENDNFRLYVQGRAQIDSYNYLGPGVSSSTTLVPTVFLRRIRPEITGEILKHWQFMIAGDFGATSLDNPKGNATETVAAGPGANPTAATAKYASAQTAHIGAAPTDVFVNFHAHSIFNVQVGQFDAPFMMENRTSDKYIAFMERSIPVRDVGIPTNKEIGAMAWGELENKLFFYSLGLFDGDGQNKLNTDARGDFMARAFVHPLATVSKDELKNLQIGGSVRTGSRDPQNTNYDYNALSTQGNYTFWAPTYAGSKGTTHIIPSGAQNGVAGELRIPVSMFDLQSEVVYIHNGTRESVEGYQSTNTERFGDMHGASYYVQLGFWPVGNRDINGMPGYENPPHLNFKKADPERPHTETANDQPKQALQVLVKWEQLLLTYQSASRAGAVDPKNVDGDITMNAFSVGVNYWATKHIRLSANYVLDMFPDSAPTKATSAGSPVQTSNQRAQAPGNTLATGVDDTARNTASTLHEILFRVGVAL
jgi:phosphate-selective porin